MRRFRAERGHGHHKRGILEQDPGVAVVRMIIPRPRPQDDVGLPLSNQAGERAAILQGGHEFAIMNIEHFGLNAQDLIGPLHLGRPALRQWPPPRLL